jgi:hypothetical protein
LNPPSIAVAEAPHGRGQDAGHPSAAGPHGDCYDEGPRLPALPAEPHDFRVSNIIRRAAQQQLPAPWAGAPACCRGRVCHVPQRAAGGVSACGAGRGGALAVLGSFELCGRGRAPGKGEGTALFNAPGLRHARAGQHARVRPRGNFPQAISQRLHAHSFSLPPQLRRPALPLTG